MRQDHHAADGGWLRKAHQWVDPSWRKRHHGRQAQSARAWHRVSKLCLISAHDGRRDPLLASGRLVAVVRDADRLTRLLRSTAEHLVARCEGGRDERSNIVAACHWCNERRHLKRAKTAPSAEAYRQRVARRMAAGRWHPANRILNQGTGSPTRTPIATAGMLGPCRYASF